MFKIIFLFFPFSSLGLPFLLVILLPSSSFLHYSFSILLIYSPSSFILPPLFSPTLFSLHFLHLPSPIASHFSTLTSSLLPSSSFSPPPHSCFFFSASSLLITPCLPPPPSCSYFSSTSTLFHFSILLLPLSFSTLLLLPPSPFRTLPHLSSPFQFPSSCL